MSADSQLSFALLSHVPPSPDPGEHRVSKAHTGTVLHPLRQLGPSTSTSPSFSTIFSTKQWCLLVNGAYFRRRKALVYLLSQWEGESMNSESCQFLSFFATQLISWFLKWSCSCTGWMYLNASLRRWGSADWWIACFHLVLMPSPTLSTSPLPSPLS